MSVDPTVAVAVIAFLWGIITTRFTAGGKKALRRRAIKQEVDIWVLLP